MKRKRGILMKEYIRENLKIFVAITVLLVCTLALVGTKETLARILPDCADLHLIHYNMDSEIYTYGYSGKEIKPILERLVFGDKDGNTIIKYNNEFSIISYKNNVNIGSADIEVSISDYQGTFWIHNAFQIQPEKVTGLKMISSGDGLIELQWNEVIGADGYILYKSADGVNYTEIKEIPNGDALIYQNTEMTLNAVYHYRVSAFKTFGDQRIFGDTSDPVHYNTPLATPVITSVNNMSFTSLQVQWSAVEGAVGYQVYHSLIQGGEYTLIAELMDGVITSYLHTGCESAVENFYYVKACQSSDGELIWGNPSEFKAGKTTPNRVSLNGDGTETSVALSWKQSAGAQGYEIYRSINGSSYEMIKKIEQPDLLNWSEENLEEHSSYMYRIRPYCVVNGLVVYGSYSGTYEKAAVIIYDYSGETGMDILRQYTGRKYVWGGTSPTKGWDCSGFVLWTYKTHFGIELPRTAASQCSVGRTVNANDRTAWKPGDLIFYTENGRTVSHVAVYLGNGQMIHALSPKHGTLIQDVDYYEAWDRKTSFHSVKRYFE